MRHSLTGALAALSLIWFADLVAFQVAIIDTQRPDYYYLDPHEQPNA